MLKYMLVKVFVTDGMAEATAMGAKIINKPTVWAVYLYGGRPPFCFFTVQGVKRI